MSNKQFISNLSATYADVRRLDVKKINLKGKNILEYIKENKTVILDERGTKADDELDIWNSYVTTDENGNVIINRNAKPNVHDIDTITEDQLAILRSSFKVIDNEVLGENDEHLMYWQTDGLTVGGKVNLTDYGQVFITKSIMYYYYLPTDELIVNSNLTTFKSDLSSLTDGNSMFTSCGYLVTFESDLSSLIDGNNMFGGCINLVTFESDLSSLTDGNQMFAHCRKLSNFTTDLNSLTDGYQMFYWCSNLTSFSSDLSSLTDGRIMFSNCSNLTTFTSNLSSLTKGGVMFMYCKLDAQSVANIIHFIPQRDVKPSIEEQNLGLGIITIGIGIPNTDEAKQAFAKECYCDDWDELNQEFDDKNWVVEWQFNGEATTFDLRSPRPSTAVFASLEEVIMPTNEKERKPHYEYTSQDGSKFYNIHWYHDSNTNNEGFDYFESLEEAISAYGVIPKE